MGTVNTKIRFFEKYEPDRKILKLSDAFMNSGGCLECSALMVNINYRNNRELKADVYEDGVRAGIREGENNKLVSQI